MTNAFEVKREYLELLNQYMQAVVDNTPEKVPVTDDIRITYNGKEVKLGENELWRTVVRFQSRQSFTDPVTGNVVLLGTATNEAVLAPQAKEYPKNRLGDERSQDLNEIIRSSRKWWFYALRLRIRDGRICEIEEFTTPEQAIKFDISPAEYPLRIAALDRHVPESERCSREELVAVVDTYWLGIEKKLPPNEVLIHPDCGRLELGEECVCSKRNYHTIRSAMRKPAFRWNIIDKRWVLIDEERGVVICFAAFEQVEDAPPGFTVAEAFKVECGLIKDIIAVIRYGSTDMGWAEAK